MNQEIYVIEEQAYIYNILREIFKNETYQIEKECTANLDQVLKSIPTLIVINEDDITTSVETLCSRIRQDEDNSITPIIVISSNCTETHCIEVLRSGAEYYLWKHTSKEYLYHTIQNLIHLLYINRRVSPLTGLPGNVQIQAEMKKRLLSNQEFAMLYLDLDNFKSYNDLYGFFKGDEIIKFTARTILHNVHAHSLKDSFVGHIGGDDFVAIVEGCDYEAICQDIILEFDREVKKYCNEEDVKRGYLEVENRRGVIEQFPLTTISIGVVVVDSGRFANTLEIGEVGAQVKHLSKSIMGSAYVIDRRKK